MRNIFTVCALPRAHKLAIMLIILILSSTNFYGQYALTSLVATNACAGTKQSTVTLSTLSASLPKGTYSVQYTLSYNGYSTVQSATMVVQTSGTGQFLALLNVMSATERTRIRVSTITPNLGSPGAVTNNESNEIYMASLLKKPTAGQGYGSCNNYVAQWQNDTVDEYFLDVALDPEFTIFLPGYNNKSVGNVHSHTITSLQNGGIYYYRVRSKNDCGISENSNVVMFTERGDGSSTPGKISGGSGSVCVGSTTPPFRISDNWPATGVWSIFNQSGEATITQTGVVTGVKAGNVRVVFTTTNGCKTSTSVSLTVGGASAGVASIAPKVCINTTIPPITHTTSGATGIGTASGLPAGVTAVWKDNKITISGVPTESGTFNYSIPLLSACSGVNATGTVVVTPATVPVVTISSPITTICQGTKVTFTASPVNGGSAPAYQWFVNGAAVAGQMAATFETKELKNGDKVSVKLTPSPQQCVSPEPVVSNVLTMSEETSVYENGKWSKGIPTAENQLSAEIRQTYSTADGAVSACSVHLVGDAIVTVVPKNPLTVYNNINLDNGTKLTVQSDANLIQVNDSAPANTGNITVLRDLKIKPKSAEYNYFGSPVTFAAGQSMKTIYPGITYVLYHNEANNYFYNSSGANVPGRGLAVKEPSITADTPNGAYDITAAFIGVPQNGIINFALANSNTATSSHLGYNLVGNPYPSNIDLQALYELNKGEIAADPAISTSFYFWDSTANNVYVQQGSSYGGQAYGVFNAKSGSTGMGIPAAGPKEGLTSRKIPKSEITVGQGFMVKALKKNATLQFNNSIRTDKNSGVKFIGARGEEGVDDRYWLSVTTPGNLTSTLAVVYFDGGTDALGAEDSEARGGSDEVFSHVSGKNIAINGKSTFADTDVVEIGTRHFAAGLHTIALEKAEGIFASGQQIYLKDKITGAVTNLSQGNYAFEAQPGESTGRFEIVYKPGSVLATDVSTKEEVQVYRAADDFVVKAPKRITSLEIYDMSGRLVRAFRPNTPEAVVNGSELANGVYLMNVKQGQEQTVKKIVK